MWIVALLFLLVVLCRQYVIDGSRALYHYVKYTYINQSAGVAIEKSQSMLSATSEIQRIIESTDGEIAVLTERVAGLKTQFATASDTNISNIISILEAELFSLQLKSARLKELAITNKDLMYDAGVDTLDTAPEAFYEGYVAEESQNQTTTLNSEQGVEKQTEYKQTMSPTAVTDLEKENTEAAENIKRTREQVKKEPVRVKRERKSVDEMNKRRAERGMPLINREALDARKAKLEEKKEARKARKQKLKELRIKFTEETNPIKRNQYKMELLAELQKHKNENAKDTSEEEKINDDEQTLASGSDVREIEPIEELADLAMANNVVADSIEAEIANSEKIITDTVSNLTQDPSESSLVIHELQQQVTIETELSAEETALLDAELA